MKIASRDADDRRDLSGSFWIGGTFVGLAALMYASGIGDAMLQAFFLITGLIPLVLGFALTPRHP